MASGNGDRANRQVKATEAYANLSRDIQELRKDLLSDDEVTPGALVRVLGDLREIKANPMVRLGFAMRTTGGVMVAAVVFVSSVATAVGGALQIAHWLQGGTP